MTQYGRQPRFTFSTSATLTRLYHRAKNQKDNAYYCATRTFVEGGRVWKRLVPLRRGCIKGAQLGNSSPDRAMDKRPPRRVSGVLQAVE